MGDQKVYYLYSVALGASIVNQTRMERLNPAISLTRQGHGGHVDDNFAAIAAAQPAIQFSTTAIARALNTLGDINGLAITTTPFDAFFYQGELGGTRAASGHLKMSLSKGIIVPTTLRAPHNPPATIDYQAVGRMDGENSPLSIAGSVVPDVTLDPSQFCAGPVVINGTELDGVQDITLNFGITLEIRSDKGNVWPRYVGIRRRVPTATVRFTNSEHFVGVVDPDGTAITSATAVYLRAVEQGGTRVADATAAHIEALFAEGIVTIGDANATEPNPFDNSITISPRIDSGADPDPIIQFDTTATLP